MRTSGGRATAVSHRIAGVEAALLAPLLAGWPVRVVRSQVLEQVNVSSQGVPGDALAAAARISADGRFVAFESPATNLHPGPLQFPHVFVRDRLLGQTHWASPLPNGSSGPFGADSPTISSDGRYVAMRSFDPLTPGDTPGNDVFVRDIRTGTTILASVSAAGGVANGGSLAPRISGNGRFVAFWSEATDLVSNDTNGIASAFVRDLLTGTTEMLDVSSSGVQANQSPNPPFEMSEDGRYVAFRSTASNLVAGDLNGIADIFLRDRANGTTVRLAIAMNGAEPDGQLIGVKGMSGDGRFVLFDSLASNLVPGDTNGLADVFVHDTLSGATRRVNVGSTGVQADSTSVGEALSPDGRYVLFVSSSAALALRSTAPGVDLFLHDLATAETRMISVTPNGASADGATLQASISADGGVVAYASLATNLVPAPANAWLDVFAVRPFDLAPAVYCSATTNSQGCVPSMSWSGVPSATSGLGFDLGVSGVLPSRKGTLLYSTIHPAAVPFLGGTLCLAAPWSRTPLLDSGGAAPCTGSYSFDFNAWIASGADPVLVLGRPVWAQYWSRDPQAGPVGRLNLSDAVYFEIGP